MRKGAIIVQGDPGSAAERRYVAPSGGGRPTVINEENALFMARNIEAGVSISGALRLAGVPENSHRRAMKRAQEPDAPAHYVRYHEILTKALGKFEQALVKPVMSSKDPAVMLNTLGRRFPEEWGANQKLTVGKDPADMTAEEALAAFAERIEIADPASPARRALFNSLLAEYGPEPIPLQAPPPALPAPVESEHGPAHYVDPDFEKELEDA